MKKASLEQQIGKIESATVRSILGVGAKKPGGYLLPDFYTPLAIEILADYILELEKKGRKDRNAL